jgi:hypothetical protein
MLFPSEISTLFYEGLWVKKTVVPQQKAEESEA